MNKLIKNLMTLAQEEGFNETRVQGVGLYKASQSTERAPLCYSQGIIFVVQGQKRIYFDHKVYNYNAKNYLALTIPLPAECETIVEPELPLLALTIDFNMTILNELVRFFDDHGLHKSQNTFSDTKGLFISRNTDELNNSLLKLSDCLLSPLKSDVFGRSVVREILYYILTGPQAAPLFALVSHNSHLARLERVIKYLHCNYQNNVEIDQLATMANMSASSFHRNFKRITACSPKQYIKKMRLSRARDLLLDQGLKVKQAAAEVGYESPTQFSREFSRYFGVSPSESNKLQ